MSHTTNFLSQKGFELFEGCWRGQGALAGQEHTELNVTIITPSTFSGPERGGCFQPKPFDTPKALSSTEGLGPAAWH